MAVVLGIGFLAGLLTIVSPCILPVLPAVIASGVTAGGRRRALAIAVGLALAFGLSALFSIRVLQALGLPLGLRYDIAIGVLLVLAASLLVPRLGELVERPFARISAGHGPARHLGGFVLGASLGLLYLPCGGPILATIAAVGGSSTHIGGAAVALTAAYSLGIGLPVFALVLAADRLTSTTAYLRTHALALRRAGGALLALSALAIAFGAATSLQTAIPSYTASVEAHLTKSGSVSKELSRISDPHETSAARRIHTSLTAPDPSPASGASLTTTAPLHGSVPITDIGTADPVPTLTAGALQNYGPAPDFAGITQWFNTPGDTGLSLKQLRGKVVLVDFWTYSCINCLRSLPHVKAWYARYHGVGFEVVGVHTPEFDFEHVASNVRAALSRLGIDYPVAMDNNYDTWNAWGNNSWPAEYLIDAKGDVRYGSIGEGDYGVTEAAIRALLQANGASLPPPTSVPDNTPTAQLSPESYLGSERIARYVGSPLADGRVKTYRFATTLKANQLTLSGAWTELDQSLLAGDNAALRLSVTAHDVYLVLSGTGTVHATLNGEALPTQRVAGVPEVYAIVSGTALRHGILQLAVSPGVQAYDFTFG